MVAVLGSGGVASHRCAAALHRLDGAPSGVVEVTLAPGRNYRRQLAHHSADLPPAEVASVDGVPATNVTRTAIDLGAVCDADTVERVLECGIRRGLTSAAYLGRRVDARARRGRPGIAVARLVLARRQPVVLGSDLEVRFLQLVRNAGLAEPVAQHPIGPYRVDFAYPHRRLFVELDELEAHGGAVALQRDLARQNWLVGKGWTPLRFTWADVVRQPAAVVAALSAVAA